MNKKTAKTSKNCNLKSINCTITLHNICTICTTFIWWCE